MVTQIVGGLLQLRYNIGSDSLDTGNEEQVMTLSVIVTDGALHTAKVTRVGKRFSLVLDGGEGGYSAQHEGKDVRMLGCSWLVSIDPYYRFRR